MPPSAEWRAADFGGGEHPLLARWKHMRLRGTYTRPPLARRAPDDAPLARKTEWTGPAAASRTRGIWVIWWDGAGKDHASDTERLFDQLDEVFAQGFLP